MVWLKRDSLAPAPRRLHSGAGPAMPARLPASDVLGRIRERIEQGQFAPGSRLPPERALAAEFGVGRPALREAIKVLSGLGILESRRGSGTYVKPALPAPDRPPLLGEAAPATFSMMDLLEVRKILEPRAAWLAATRASESQLRQIESARRRLEMHDRDWKTAARLDYELHASIIGGANNPVLLMIYEFLMARILEIESDQVRFAPDVQLVRHSHKAIVEAILKRQADAAERAMTDHLHAVAMNLIREAKA